MYKFIFVDDEDFIRELFKSILDYHAYGFHMEADFGTAEEAQAYLKNHEDISAVITDIKMGKKSGIDFCEEIRKNDPEMLLVILSGYREFEYAQRAISSDVFEYLVKPTSYEDLDRLFTRMKKQLDKKKKVEGEKEEVSYENMIGRIKKYIGEHYAEELSLEGLAEFFGMNAAYLSRFFKKHTGMNFMEYLTKVRMEAAIRILADPTVKVYEVCEQVGYTSQQYFLMLFKKYTGQTPSEYRKNRAWDGKEG